MTINGRNRREPAGSVPSGMWVLSPDGELSEVLADPDETMADTIWSKIGDTTETVDFGGFEMWFDAEAPENHDYTPVPNRYASAIAYQLGGEQEFIFGSVVFAGKKKGQPGPVNPRHRARIGEVLATITGGVARTPNYTTLGVSTVGRQLEEVMLPAMTNAARILQNCDTGPLETQLARDLMFALREEFERLFFELSGGNPMADRKRELLIAVGLDTPDCPNCRTKTGRSALGYDCPECKTKWDTGPIILGQPVQMTPYTISHTE